ncbi:hypothetical protein N7505_007772 [Penicillium chrysogenum]|uniref:HAT C-terminal dimerisation domain-containing protein n=1 Tax=Penicillium chrysogenum TaxID=5076 RepID=A0ABQ8WEJ5_PENCH|nr:hypothetical protein N7505_007772 [Penicillium chrysogenum]
MLRRAKRLRTIFSLFCTEYDCEEMLLSEQGWWQIDYLLYITEPFFDYTTQLSKTRDVTAHYVFMIYNKLYDHLERSQVQLRRKRVPWKKQMLVALEAGRSKLDEYYSQSDDIKANIYAISTMLAPEALVPYQAQVRTSGRDLQSSLAIARPSSRLEEMLDGRDIHPRATTDEISQYLDSDTISVYPFTFWKEHRDRFPAIAALARNTLSFPATGAGVGRLFNTARDICHYRRGR